MQKISPRLSAGGIHFLEQSRDFSFRCHVDAVGGGVLAEAGHGHDGSGDGYDKACAGVYIDVAHVDVKAGGTAELGLVIRQRILCLCDADRQIAKAEVCQLL